MLLANDYVPTPAVSYNVKKLGAAGGVMITSSHNPWNWNGVKFKAQIWRLSHAGDHEGRSKSELAAETLPQVRSHLYAYNAKDAPPRVTN